MPSASTGQTSLSLIWPSSSTDPTFTHRRRLACPSELYGAPTSAVRCIDQAEPVASARATRSSSGRG
jgi:hypothetical protein